MPTPSPSSRLRVAMFIAIACLTLFILPVVQRGELNSGQPGATKLTTVLGHLANAMPQEHGPVSMLSPQRAINFSSQAMPKAVQDALATRMLRINSNGEAQVYILMNAVNDENLSQLRASGVTIETSDPQNRRVQARVPVTRLQDVSALPFVTFIHLPNYAFRMTGSVNTEGDAILKADLARQQLGVDGSGVFVGVISDGIKGLFATGCTTCSFLPGGPMDPAKGDLPPATGTRNSSGVLLSSTGGVTGLSFQANGDLEGITPGCGFPGAGAEGTALMEIVHDIAPGAKLSFANAGTDVEFNNAVNNLAAGNDVVMDDLGFFGLPNDGTSSVSVNTANALNSATFPIRGYYTAVGNLSDVHYFGAFSPSTTDGSTFGLGPGKLHVFQANSTTSDTQALGPQPFNQIKLQGTTSTGSAGGSVVAFLSWDDPSGTSTNTYDLYLVQHGTNTVVAHSAGKSCEGPGFPVACLQYVSNFAADTFFDIMVQNPNNASNVKNLNLFVFTPECAFGSLISLGPNRAKLNFNTPTRSVIAEGDAGGTPVSVVSVGAICSGTAAAQQASTTSGTNFPDPSCQDTTNSTIQFYSSLGPTLDGLGRNKPEIYGIDGVSVTGSGGFGSTFFGTSAATPHVAGIAALLLESKVCLLTNVPGSQSLDNVTARSELRDLLVDGADPLATPIGSRRANALISTLATVPVFGVSPTTLVIGGNTPTGVSLSAPDLGFSEPITCVDAILSFTGGCGTSAAGATRMNCPFGNNNVTVAASNSLALTNQPTFSASQNLQILVTGFTLGASPASNTVPAGQPAAYTVTATSAGGTYPSGVALTCGGLPGAATCSFSPPSVTPGATSAQSTLTIRTTTRSLVPPTNWQPTNWLQWLATFVRPQLLFSAVALLVAMGLAVGAKAMRRMPQVFGRNLMTAGALAFALAFLSMQIACGGGGTTTPPPPAGTPAGTYTVTVSGTSGTLVKSSPVTLVVQ